MDRLLILACSQCKDPAADLLPAIERYNGPAFRVLRKYLREGLPGAPTVWVLSAKFGLIEADRGIPAYDCRMSRARAREMQAQVQPALRPLLTSRRWREVGLCAGRLYRIALEGLQPLLPDGSRFVLIDGGQGTRLTHLRAWLRRPIPATDR